MITSEIVVDEKVYMLGTANSRDIAYKDDVNNEFYGKGKLEHGSQIGKQLSSNRQLAIVNSNIFTHKKATLPL